MIQIIKKLAFIRKTRKELNEKNPDSLNYLKRRLYQVEKNIVLKYIFVTILIFLSIALLNYFFENVESSVYDNYINFPLSDVNSARYFFSTIPQSLAALVAISFTVLLIYLQISVDKYSIQTVKYVFDRWEAVMVLSIFWITIIYSLFKLGKVRDMEASFPWDHEMKTIFILTILCTVFLIVLFHKIISSLMPENFMRKSNERIKKASIRALDFVQLIQIKNDFFKHKINSLKNVDESYHYGAFGLLSGHPITTQQYGFIQDIDFTKIEKASKLLHSISGDCRLQLNKPIEEWVSSEANVLAYIECPEDEIIRKVETLVKRAYKIDNKKRWILEDYKELEPLSSLTIKAIKDFDTGVAEIALEQLTDTVINYARARKHFGLMPSCEQAKNMRFGRYFLDESFGRFKNVAEVSIKENNSHIVNLIIYLTRTIGDKSIALQDLDALKKVTQFYLYFSHRLEDDFIYLILHESNNLEMKTQFDLENEINNIDYIKSSKFILDELIDYYGSMSKILIDKQNRFTIKSLSKLLRMYRDLERLTYDNRKFELKRNFERLKPANSEYIKIKNELEIIEEKEIIGKELKLNIDLKVYSIGSYLMVNLEREKHTIGFSIPLFDKLADYYKRNNLEETFGKLSKTGFMTLHHWFNEIDDGDAHFINTSHSDRFYLLMNAILHRKGKKLNEIRVINQFNKTRLDTIKAECIKLKDKSHIWDQLLKTDSKKYFDDILIRLEECAVEREINLGQKIRQAELSSARVEKVKSDILSHIKRYSVARNFINIEHVVGECTDYASFGKNTLYEKIFFLSDTIDPTTTYDYSNIGDIVGSQIGIGESEYIVKQIFERINIKKNIIHFDILSIQNLNVAREMLKERGFTATTILISPYLNHELWRIKEFTHSESQTDEIPRPFGTLDGIEFYPNRVIPNGVAIIFDKNQIATLKIIEKLNPTITTDFDKEEIIKTELKEGKINDEQKDERLNELDGKVNIRALEKIKFEFGNDEAGLVLFFKPSDSHV